MKLKLDQTRTYDKDGLRKRAACLCLRSEEKPDVLLVSSSSSKDLWVVPGGGIDPGEAPATAALREIKEEAGVRGRMIGLLDVFENTARKTRTYVYVVIVEHLADEYDDVKIGRTRRWFSIEDACRELQRHKPVQTLYMQTYIKRKATGSTLVVSHDSVPEQLTPDSPDLLYNCDGNNVNALDNKS